LVEQLDRNLGNQNNYFSSDKGVVKEFKAVLDKIIWVQFTWDDAGSISSELGRVYESFWQGEIIALLGTEASWNL
jgi:hypothetical protein